jgi:hypothetical protein
MKQVKLPDGSIVGFPDKMSDDSIKQVLRQKFPPTQQQAPQQQPESRGIGERVLRVAQNVPSNLGQKFSRAGTGALNAFYELGKGTANLAGGVSEALGNPWQENVDRNVNRINAFLKQREKNIEAEKASRINQGLFDVDETVGEIAASAAMYPYRLGAKAVQTLPKVSGPLMEGAKRFGRIAREGAIGSVLFTPSTGEGDYTTQKAVQAGTGALAGLGFAGGGKVIGAAGGAIAKKIAGKTPTETMPVDFENLKFSDIQSMAGTNKEADIRAVNKVVDTLKKAYPDNYQQVIDAWATSGKPLIEVFNPKVTSLAETSALYSQGLEQAQKYFPSKTQGTAERTKAAIAKNVSPVDNFLQGLEDRVKTGQQAAAPLYEEAFQPKGVAALKNTLQKQWSSAGNTIGSLRKELNGLKQELDLVSGKEASRPFNVYGQSNINKARSDLTSKIEQKTAQLEKAILDREQIASFMKEAMADESAGKKAVWSPRLQEFLSDPSYQQFFKKGLEIQRLEALGSGKKFNPSEYGVTGIDANGEPIVSKVPNLKMLDTFKKGMDEQIAARRDPITKRMDNEGRLLAKNQSQFVSEIDRILGPQNAYARARKVSGDYLSAEQSMRKGDAFFTTRPEEVGKIFKKMTPSEKAAYKDGVANAAKTRIDKIRSEGGNPYTILMGRNEDVSRWGKVLSPKEFNDFQKALKEEDLLYKTKNQVLGNSATARRQNLSKDFELNGGDVLASAGSVKTLGLSQLAKWLKKSASGLTDDMAGSVAKILYEDNPRQKALLMKQVFGDERLSESEKKMIKDVYVRAEGPIEELKVRLRAGASATAVNAMQE